MSCEENDLNYPRPRVFISYAHSLDSISRSEPWIEKCQPKRSEDNVGMQWRRPAGQM